MVSSFHQQSPALPGQASVAGAGLDVARPSCRLLGYGRLSARACGGHSFPDRRSGPRKIAYLDQSSASDPNGPTCTVGAAFAAMDLGEEDTRQVVVEARSESGETIARRSVALRADWSTQVFLLPREQENISHIRARQCSMRAGVGEAGRATSSGAGPPSTASYNSHIGPMRWRDVRRNRDAQRIGTRRVPERVDVPVLGARKAMRSRVSEGHRVFGSRQRQVARRSPGSSLRA